MRAKRQEINDGKIPCNECGDCLEGRTPLKKEIARLTTRVRRLESVLRRVPIARMRADFSGMECIGCEAGPGVQCSGACWANWLEQVMSSPSEGEGDPR